MSSKIFVNLPVKDLERTMAFFKSLGFSFNPQFSDATAACMVISEHIYSMLLTHEKFSTFLPGGKAIADASRTTEVLVALSMDSRAEVDRLADAALAAGGTAARPPADHGFMYERSFNDLDGHVWEVFYMDMAAVPQPAGAA